MISPELRARIRRLFFAEHWRVGTIATELGVHHDTVRHAIESDRFVPVGRPKGPSRLDAYKPLILDTLEQHPRLRATRLFKMLRDRGFFGQHAAGPTLRKDGPPAWRPRSLLSIGNLAR